jgi:hypothetical protein
MFLLLQSNFTTKVRTVNGFKKHINITVNLSIKTQVLQAFYISFKIMLIKRKRLKSIIPAGASKCFTVHEMLLGDQIKKDVMGRVCGMHGSKNMVMNLRVSYR